jgi:hypothetical protein
MSDFLMLTTLAKGTSAHPRFVIADQFGRVWAGRAWSDNENDGLVFADLNELGGVCRELLLDEAGAKPVFRFSASMEIDVVSDKKPDWINVIVWAIQAVQLSIDYHQNGSGPIPKSLAILRIDWGTLKEIENCVEPESWLV